MAQMTLPDDFKEFLRLLGATGVEYLLVGSCTVGHHGYPRYTADIDVWVPVDLENARRLSAVLRDFGFDKPDVTPELFLREQTIVRMGVPPMRIEITNHIAGSSSPPAMRGGSPRRLMEPQSTSSRWMISTRTSGPRVV